MLQALLYEKLARHLDKNPFDVEDLLTSVVLGTCSYAAPAEGLLPFLRKAVDPDGVPLSIEGVEAATYEFWPPWDALVTDGAPVAAASEPEVVVTLRHGDDRTTVILLEAKLHAGKSSLPSSGTEVTDQLGKYWLHLRARAPAGAVLGIVYITKDVLLPRAAFAETQEELAQKGHPLAPLHWVSWRAFASAVAHVTHPLVADVCTLLRDKWNLVYTPMGPWPSPPPHGPTFTFDARVSWPVPPERATSWRFGVTWPILAIAVPVWSLNVPR